MADSWWLVSNTGGGITFTQASDATEARRNYRERIVEAGLSEGMSPSAARRYAGTFRVWVVAGGCTLDEVQDAYDAWSDNDLKPAQALRRRWRPSSRPVADSDSNTKES